MKKGWYIPQLIVIRQNISWIKSYRIGAFWLFHPSRLKYVLNVLAGVIIPVWNVGSMKPATQKRQTTCGSIDFSIFFLRLCSNPCSNPTKKKSRTLPPLTQRNFGVWLKGKNWLQEDGVFVLYSSKVPACMHVCIYIYTIWLTVCYGNRVHLWRRYLYVPIKHDDFT